MALTCILALQLTCYRRFHLGILNRRKFHGKGLKSFKQPYVEVLKYEPQISAAFYSWAVHVDLNIIYWQLVVLLKCKCFWFAIPSSPLTLLRLPASGVTYDAVCYQVLRGSTGGHVRWLLKPAEGCFFGILVNAETASGFSFCLGFQKTGGCFLC